MSTAMYPQGMKSWNNHLPQGGYKTWKGSGVYSNPVGETSSHVRPLTNNDVGNVFPTGFGLPRPIKHYRRGRVVTSQFDAADMPSADIQYNVNRLVKSSTGTALDSGGGLVTRFQDAPGLFSVEDNSESTHSGCYGVNMVSSWAPTKNRTDNPEPSTESRTFCCNEQKKAIRRVLPASTLIKKNYFQTKNTHLYNRCSTFSQRSFNFANGPVDEELLLILKQHPFVSSKLIEYAKPGSALSLIHHYTAQCSTMFTVHAGAESQFVQTLLTSMLEQQMLTQPQYDELFNGDAKTVFKILDTLVPMVSTAVFKHVVAYLHHLSLIGLESFLTEQPKNAACGVVYYKPSNPQFATQGGVSSSTRILKLKVDTISTAAAHSRTLNNAETPFIYKDKTPVCNKATYVGNPFFFQGQRQRRSMCW